MKQTKSDMYNSSVKFWHKIYSNNQLETHTHMIIKQ
jgi:hypothetical protein